MLYLVVDGKLLGDEIKMSILKNEFFRRNPKIVAIELLGKILVRKIENKTLEGMIVETEAYFGEDDPASRAYHGKKNYN